MFYKIWNVALFIHCEFFDLIFPAVEIDLGLFPDRCFIPSFFLS